MENITFEKDLEVTSVIMVEKEIRSHPLLKCEAFKKQSVNGRWQTVKRFGLCFRCLADNHHGKSCPRRKQYGINREDFKQNLQWFESCELG